MNQIHPTAIISNKAQLGSNNEIGPYCIIGDKVKMGDGNILKSHVVLEGNSEIGSQNIFFPFSYVSDTPQDLKFIGEDAKIIIGNKNQIREHATIHPGTKGGIMETRVGSNCLLMVNSHIAHDCVVGNNVILANNATLAGHVEVDDFVIIGGLAAIHQFVRIGKYAMIGGMSGVKYDVIPFGVVSRDGDNLSGLNLIGMKRKGFLRQEIHDLRHFYKELFTKDGNKDFKNKAEQLSKKFPSQGVQEVANFINAKASRELCFPVTISDEEVL